jgi:hypothetical protein
MKKQGFIWTQKDDEKAIAEMRKRDPNFVADENSLITPQSLCPHCGKHRYEHFDYSNSSNPYDGKYLPCEDEREYYLRKYFTTEMDACLYKRPEETPLEALFSVYELGYFKKAKIKNALVVSEYNLFLAHLQAFTEYVVFRKKVRKFNIQFVDVLMLRSKKFDEAGRSDFGMFDDKHLLIFDLSRKGYSNIADESHVEELILHRKSKGLPIWFWNPTRWITNPNIGDKNIKEVSGDNFTTMTIGDVSGTIPAEVSQESDSTVQEKKTPSRNAKQVGGKQLKGGARV